jgi:UPF0755 protein
VRLFLIIAGILSVITFSGFFYFSYSAEHSRGVSQEAQRFEVKQGENVLELSARLKSTGLIYSRYAFLWEIVREGKAKSLVAGTYELSGNLSITEITFLITEGKIIPRDIRVTFPEGWDVQKMSERLTANNLPGTDFYVLAEKPNPKWRKQFYFLADLPEGASLQGFLFPDTYFFDKEDSAETIIEKMLANFGNKINAELRTAAKNKNQNFYAAVILASIVENEVRSENDRKMVSDIFLRRLSLGKPLESDATVKYILGIDKIQHTFEETRVASPYNTYTNTGLPPSPIGNPGLISIRAAIFPEDSSYFYFLSDPKTGETIFSITYDEHLRNKKLHGL